MQPLTYEVAVKGLDNFLQTKTTHSTKSILNFMQTCCNLTEWVNNEDQNEYANMCSNFDKYVQATGKTSIGRKQFEEVWESGFQLPLGVDYQMHEDPLPDFDAAMKQIEDYSKTVDNSPQAHRIKVENTELRNEVNRLKAELKAANDKLEAIRGIILWG